MTYVDDGEPTARVAYAIGRRVGNAVERNRLRRRIRAVLASEALRPGAHLVTADRSVLTMSHAQLVVRIDQLVGAVYRRQDESGVG